MEMTLPNVVVDTVGSFLFQSFVWSKKKSWGHCQCTLQTSKKGRKWHLSVAYSFGKLSPPCSDTDTWVLLSFSPLRIRLCL